MSLIAPNMHNNKTRPRIAVMSVRNTENHVSRACGYEFEDMICNQLDFARLIAPGHGRRAPVMRGLRNRAIRAFGPNKAFDLLNAGAEKTPLGIDYDLFFFSAAQPRDLTELANVPDWRDRSRFAVCWMQELWALNITDDNKLLDILEQFDHVICSFHGSIEPLQARISTPVSYMPWGVDTELFCPFPNPPARAIQVAGIGEVPKAAENALVRHADETGGFYHYQTVFGPSVARSHREHRANYAGILKRSEYFLSYMAKYSNPERGTQEEFGLRYIEGVAAGTVMLGDPINNPAFETYFGWKDSVIPLSVEDEAPEELIKALNQQPERIAAARRNNVVNALLKLDNQHRWQDILDIAGMLETPAMLQRRKRLAELADMVRTSSDEEILGLKPVQHAISQSHA